jgi:hypothetical protein
VLTFEQLAQGLTILGAAFGRDVTPVAAEAYRIALSERLTPETWETAVRTALTRERFFPSAAILLTYGCPADPPKAAAAKVYEEILDAFERGERLGYRDVAKRWGATAGNAFVAAGGTAAFEWCELAGRPFRLKAFQETWVEQVQTEPVPRSLPAAERAALPASRSERERG